MNFVVLSAALSSAMCNLYFTARMLFSLARGGFAPSFLGKLSKNGMPVAAVLASGFGLLAALVLSQIFERTAFVFLIGVAFFGGPFIWLMTLLTHIAFRRSAQRKGTAHRSHRAARNLEFPARHSCAAWPSSLPPGGFPAFTLLCGRAVWLALPHRCVILSGPTFIPAATDRELHLMDELLKWRSEFPILSRSTYLISNSLGAMPEAFTIRCAVMPTPGPNAACAPGKNPGGILPSDVGGPARPADRRAPRRNFAASKCHHHPSRHLPHALIFAARATKS